MLVAYCELWSNEMRSPTDVLTEAKARDRHARGEQYCVVLGDPGAPQAILEIGRSALRVSFVDEEGRTNTQYLFRKMENGMLFLGDVTTWAYPEGAEDMSEASRIESAQLRPDGYASRTIDDSSTDQIEKTEYMDVPVETNWEPMPEFGHWESVARYDRDAPPKAE